MSKNENSLNFFHYLVVYGKIYLDFLSLRTNSAEIPEIFEKRANDSCFGVV